MSGCDAITRVALRPFQQCFCCVPSDHDECACDTAGSASVGPAPATALAATATRCLMLSRDAIKGAIAAARVGPRGDARSSGI